MEQVLKSIKLLTAWCSWCYQRQRVCIDDDDDYDDDDDDDDDGDDDLWLVLRSV